MLLYGDRKFVKKNNIYIDCTIEELSSVTCNKILSIREANVRMVNSDSIVILAKWKGEIVGHAVLKPCGEKSECNIFWKDKNYIHYCYVVPIYRKKNIYPYMLAYLVQKALRNSTEKQVYISADCNNNSSI